MSEARTRVLAMYRKDVREYRRNRSIVATMAILPLGIVVFPLLYVLALPASEAEALRTGDPLVILLGIPALLPSIVAAYAVVGEREQDTLESVLATPIRREELLLAKALAAFVPTLAVAYVMYGLFLACTVVFAQPAVASAVLHGPNLLVQTTFTPLIATLSIWIGLGISVRTSDVRVAQQLGALASLPTLVVAYLIVFDVIPATLGVTLAMGAALLVLDALGWRFAAAAFDRERLITGTH
jgi:ABC-2 type transport system permease protein